MVNWWKRGQEFRGTVLLPDTAAPPAGYFERLRNDGIEISQGRASADSLWTLELRHPEWGAARLDCPRNVPPPPAEIFEFSFISDEERSRAVTGKTTLRLTMRGPHGDLLRDRKLALRYLRAVLGRDGAVAIDDVAQKVWPLAALDDELEHDADLDIEGIYSIHAVRDEESGSVHWVHTHGLSEIGHFDFDILDPSPDLTTMFGMDVIRAMAFRIVEGNADRGTPIPLVHPGGEVTLIPVDEFLDSSDHPSAERLRSDADTYHRNKHMVLCEPQRRGLLGRFLDRGLVPSRFLAEPIGENVVVPFSTASTLLSAKRARETYGQLLRLSTEFSELDLPVMVKLGYPVDDAPDDEREHLWFQVDGLRSDSIDATLVNQPYNVSKLTQGQRGAHDPGLLSDWMMLTPVGTINPRNTTAVRNIRSDPGLVRRALEEAGPVR